jgi:hypothetical protein
MVVPLRPAFCLVVILFYLVVSYPTTIESTGYEPIYSVDFVCCVCYHYHPLVVVDFFRL